MYLKRLTDIALTLLAWLAAGFALASSESQSALYQGASIYVERCALCHGSNGGGEGVLPMSIKGYPDTNLLDNGMADNYSHIRQTIERGGAVSENTTQMPPWIDELSSGEIDAVASFVLHLNRDGESALKILSESPPAQPFDARGPALFATRCALCHGANGEGNGRMARIIKEPPPYNLTGSVVPPQYVRLIVNQGGEALGRSKRMPPFGKDLMPWEVDSLIEHVLDLREREI